MPGTDELIALTSPPQAGVAQPPSLTGFPAPQSLDPVAPLQSAFSSPAELRSLAPGCAAVIALSRSRGTTRLDARIARMLSAQELP